jgi:hypothetical protein
MRKGIKLGLNAVDVSNLLGLSESVVRQDASKGRIKSAKVGNNLIFDMDGVKERVRERPANSTKFDFGSDAITPFDRNNNGYIGE